LTWVSSLFFFEELFSGSKVSPTGIRGKNGQGTEDVAELPRALVRVRGCNLYERQVLSPEARY
jgi:hypothetical protein